MCVCVCVCVYVCVCVLKPIISTETRKWRLRLLCVI